MSSLSGSSNGNNQGKESNSRASTGVAMSGETGMSMADTSSNKRAALAGQWRTPPLPVYSTSAMSSTSTSTSSTNSGLQGTTSAGATASSAPGSAVPTGQLATPATSHSSATGAAAAAVSFAAAGPAIPALPPVSQLPSSAEDYAKALQEAYRRGAEAAAAMAAAASLGTTASCPNFAGIPVSSFAQPQNQMQQVQQAPLPPPPAAPEPPAQQQAMVAAPQPQPGALHGQFVAQDAPRGAPTVQNPLVHPNQTMPPPPPVALQQPPPSQQQTAIPTQPPAMQHLMGHPHPTQAFVPGVPQTVATPTAAAPAVAVAAPPPVAPAAAAATTTVATAATVTKPATSEKTIQLQQRSMSLPDMTSYAAQQEEDKRQKRLARNRASARLRRLRKKNLVDAYEAEVGILEKTLQQLRSHEWGAQDDANALIEALSMDRGQQVMDPMERKKAANDILEQQLRYLEQLEELMQEQYVLHHLWIPSSNDRDENADNFDDLKELLQLSDEQMRQLHEARTGWEEEWAALQTLKESLQAMKDNNWLWNEGCSEVADQFVSILHKNQLSKFLLWADHNVDAIDELDAVHASETVPQGPVFHFGVDSSPEGLMEEEK